MFSRSCQDLFEEVREILKKDLENSLFLEKTG